jgi:hypothetical protein
MRKPLHDIEQTEQYLLNRMDDPDRMLFEAKMIIDPQLKNNAVYQRKTYAIVRWFARKQEKIRLDSIYNNLMRDKNFAAKINSIFS